MCLVHLRHGEVAVVGGDKRNTDGVGQRNQARFERSFMVQAVAMQFHRDAVGECFDQACEQAFRFGFLSLAEQSRDRAGGSTSEQDQPGGVRSDSVHRELRLQTGIGVEKPGGGQALKIGEPRRILRQQHDRVGRQARGVGASQRNLAADDRLNAFGGAGLAELQRAEQIGGVGDRHRRHAGVTRQRRNFLRFDGTFAERVGGMDAQMDEISVGHAGSM